MSKKKKNILPKKTVAIIIALTILNLILLLIFFIKNDLNIENKSNDYPELSYLSNTNMPFSELSDYFKSLAKNRGGVYAFEILKKAKLPNNIDLHLLGHGIGDILYKEKGIDGIKFCTQDFRNACSHTIVIGAFIEYGEKVIPKIKKICHEAPGGRGAYTMCFHGFGHGVLAYAGYDLDRAVKLCKKVGSEEFANREYVECAGGTIMEMMSGVHDRETWLKQVKKYMPQNNPLAPCNTEVMPDELKGICYTYLTPRLFEAAGSNLASPEPETYTKAFNFCNQIPKDKSDNRNICYGSFGKEFVVLASNRDIRNIGEMTEKQLKNVYEWCQKAEATEGIRACIGSALQSLFWGGENNPNASIIFCKIVGEEYQNQCYGELIGSIKYFLSDNNKGQKICEMLPDKYKQTCKSK